MGQCSCLQVASSRAVRGSGQGGTGPPNLTRMPTALRLQPKERHGTSSTYFLELLDFSGQQGAPTSCTAVVLAGLLRDRMAVLHEQFKRYIAVLHSIVWSG